MSLDILNFWSVWRDAINGEPPGKGTALEDEREALAVLRMFPFPEGDRGGAGAGVVTLEEFELTGTTLAPVPASRQPELARHATNGADGDRDLL